MTARLIITVIRTLMEEAALVAIVLWGLPQLDIHMPLPGLIAIMAAWGTFSVIFYQIGSRALKRATLVGLPTMVGGKARVISPLTPDGLVKIKDELWEALSIGGTIDIGEEVTVIGQDALKLVVRRSDSGGVEEQNAPNVDAAQNNQRHFTGHSKDE